MEYGTLKSVSVGENKDGRRQVRLLEVEVRPNDPITVELDASLSEDCVPRVGSRVYFEAITSTYNVCTRIVDPDNLVDPELGAGDHLSYALDGDGVRVATILQEADGTITLNGGTDFAILFNEMKSAFDQLKSDHDTHIHVTTATVGVGAVGTIAPTSTPSTADMSSAKVPKVKL